MSLIVTGRWGTCDPADIVGEATLPHRHPPLLRGLVCRIPHPNAGPKNREDVSKKGDGGWPRISRRLRHDHTGGAGAPLQAANPSTGASSTQGVGVAVAIVEPSADF